MAGAVVAGPLDAVRVVAGSFDDPRVGPVPALEVEVLLAGDAGHDRGEDAFLVLRGKGRRVGGPAADDADGPLEFDPISWRTMSGLLDRSTFPGPRRDVLSWAFPVSDI